MYVVIVCVWVVVFVWILERLVLVIDLWVWVINWVLVIFNGVVKEVDNVLVVVFEIIFCYGFRVVFLLFFN